MRDPMTLPRRLVLGALAAPAIIRSARADETFVLGTWGGDYQRLQLENIELPLVRPLGLEAIPDAADEPARVAKIMATRRLPRGPMDVACVQAVEADALGDAGVLEALTVENIPNLVHAKEGLGTATFAPHIWSPQIISYSPDRVSTPPT